MDAETREEFEKLNKNLIKSFKAIDSRFEAVNKRFDNLENKMDEGFNKMDEGFEEVKNMMDHGFSQLLPKEQWPPDELDLEKASIRRRL